ncbi:MAG: MoxR family ATPase [Atribacterota bacterium]|nr:MoxR family ATPase [Atribacterota bacterium]MDD4896646.1 MoxR family ATPase [Atribacterota bacterium]MDD5637120.1 MoxR family ATPase [Atribacterota bacterium]
MNFSICHNITDNINKVIVGKNKAIELTLTTLLAEGHLLLEDVPGVGKTLLARSLARSIGGTFRRIQFTPDLLPSDITGFNIYNQKEGKFVFQAGPVMSNIVLADEINRTIPRTQSSLLESMQERQVTIDGITMDLPVPFFVIGTQNPIELEGTFPLPEAQLDRFLMRIKLDYPSHIEEMLILERFQKVDPLEKLESVTTPEEILHLQKERAKVHISKEINHYIVTLTNATRNSSQIRFGASPRASLHLMRAAQALAALRGRDFVLPDDIKELFTPVLAHRVVMETKERLKNTSPQKLLQEILEQTEIPTMEISK